MERPQTEDRLSVERGRGVPVPKVAVSWVVPRSGVGDGQSTDLVDCAQQLGSGERGSDVTTGKRLDPTCYIANVGAAYSQEYC